MPLEIVNTIATVGTFLVIAATAIAAIGQLRHLRASNQIAALNNIREFHESDRFLEARKFVFDQFPQLVHDPEFRTLLYLLPGPAALRPTSTVGNLYETLGALIKNGAIDADVACDLWGGTAISAWSAMQPIIAARRHVYGPVPWENFEYFVILAKAWLKRHPTGSLPPHIHRLPIDDAIVKRDIADGIAPPFRGTGTL